MMHNFERAKWYVNRLSAMNFREVLHRAHEAVLKLVGRSMSRGWDAVTPVLIEWTPSLVGIRIGGIDKPLKAVVEREVADIKGGRFNLLGAHWPAPSQFPPEVEYWHLEPTSGYVMDRLSYCFDISFRHGVGMPEIKRIWELNRLQYLVPLALSVATTGDTETRELIFRFIVSWMEANPPYRGINWSSGIELALRLASVGVAFSIIGTDHLKQDERECLGRFVAAHVVWIARYPSLFSSANNHRIAELMGLVIGTALAPNLPGARGLRQRSITELVAEMTRQILPDGVGAEQAPAYTAFTIELFLTASLFMQDNQAEIPAIVTRRLALWADHIRWMMDGTGRVPSIGDCDDCRVVATTQAAEPRYIASVVAAVAGFLGNPLLAPPARDVQIRDLIFLSPVAGPTAECGLRTWPDGGYTVVRTPPPKAAVLILDHGPVGYLSIAAHGHADALAIWLTINDKPIFVDAGTYLYHSRPSWRWRLRSTPMHNTLSIAGQSSSLPSGPFNWAVKARARLISAKGGRRPSIVAEHDGFRAGYSVAHRRTVELATEGAVRVTDELIGAPVDEEVTISFLLPSELHAHLEGEDAIIISVRASGSAIVRIKGQKGQMKARVMHGDESAGLGWISTHFGVIEETEQVLFKGRLTSPYTICIDAL